MPTTQGKHHIDTPFLTPTEAAAYCRVDKTTLWRARKAGTLRACGPTTAVRYRRESLDAWMESRDRP